jgi:SMI1 / KNR4 family (SUKH-1)
LQDAGMPEGLIPFAQDSMGNKFCFAQDEATGERKMDLGIYFFDHDLDEVFLEANSFAEWIESYTAIIPIKHAI